VNYYIHHIFSAYYILRAYAETSRPAAKRRKKKPASGAGNASSVQSGSPTASRQKKSPGPVMFGSVVEVGMKNVLNSL